MGNYFGSFPFINSGYLPENNNTMVGIFSEPQEPKLSDSLNAVNGYSVLSVNTLQRVFKQDDSAIFKLWNGLNNLYTTPWVKSFIESNTATVLFDENHYFDTKSPKKETPWEKNETKPNYYISLNLSSKQPCLKFTTAFSTDPKARDSFSKPLESFDLKKKCEAKLCSSNKLNCETTEVDESISKSENQPFSKVIFQRLDSGIEELPQPAYRTCTQIDSDSFHLTSITRMADTHDPCLLSEEAILGHHQAVSFFIDIREPLLQKPLGEEYNFSSFSECDSMFSDQCSDDSFEDDDDFIIFDEASFDEAEEFNFSVNTSTSLDLSSSVRLNSMVKPCLGISIDSSRDAGQLDTLQQVDSIHNSRKTQSTLSVKIDVRPNSNGRTILRHVDSFNIHGCVDETNCSKQENSLITNDKPRKIPSIKEKIPALKEKQHTILTVESVHKNGCANDMILCKNAYGICKLKENKSAASREPNCSYDNDCCDLIGSSTKEINSEMAFNKRMLQTSPNSFGVCKVQENQQTLFSNGNSTRKPHCSLTLDSPEEVSIRKIPSKLKTGCLNFCTAGEKKSLKKVCFEREADLVVIHQMRHWDFAYRQARKGPWELAAVDRCRFRRRIQELDTVLSPCLKQKIRIMNMSGLS